MDNYNYLGFIIFWSYNVAALVFTGIVIYTLVSIKPTTSKVDAKRGDVTLFSILAAISFATLSYNMLNVLIQSFQEWSGTNPSAAHGLLIDVYDWSITSNLFQDFGEAIVEDMARFVWTACALLVTFCVCLYMGAEGRRQQVPRLWAFFCLSQILPISFAQNLFYIALLRLPHRTGGVVELRIRLIFLAAGYCGCVIVAPTYANTPRLIPLVLVARGLLFTPLFLVHIKDTGVNGRTMDDHGSQMLVRESFVVAALSFVVAASNKGVNLRDLESALFSHPAVSALGCDFVISIISFILWVATQGLAINRNPGEKVVETTKP